MANETALRLSGLLMTMCATGPDQTKSSDPTRFVTTAISELWQCFQTSHKIGRNATKMIGGSLFILIAFCGGSDPYS
jgi:hypothetical protein